MTEAARVVQIEGSTTKLLLLGAGGVLMTALCVVVAVPPIPELEASLFERAVAWCSMVFSACAPLSGFGGCSRREGRS